MNHRVDTVPSSVETVVDKLTLPCEVSVEETILLERGAMPFRFYRYYCSPFIYRLPRLQ